MGVLGQAVVIVLVLRKVARFVPQVTEVLQRSAATGAGPGGRSGITRSGSTLLCLEPWCVSADPHPASRRH